MSKTDNDNNNLGLHNSCNLSLRRCRTVMEYPQRQANTGLRWSEDTPMVTPNQYQDRILSVDRVWSAIAYIPFPEALHPDFPTTPVVSEEQNCSLEIVSGVPTLLFTMWQRDGARTTSFTNRAFNLCANVHLVPGECGWDTCRYAAPGKKGNFVPPKAHPLHRTNRHYFFDEDMHEHGSNNLPLLIVCSKGLDVILKEKEELATCIMVNAISGRFTAVSPGLSEAVKACAGILESIDVWRSELFESLTHFLWSGKYTDHINTLLVEFEAWCKGNQYYPAWSVEPSCLEGFPKSAFRVAVLNSVAVYGHDYGLPHLSPSPFTEQTRQLKCLTESKDFVWENGHTCSNLLTSSWVKSQLQIRGSNSVLEVKTGPWSALSGERLNIPLELGS